jgi:hypothetical protein
VIDPTWQISNTKFNLDDPTATNAYADVGLDNWSVTDLANALNANASGATAGFIPSGISYTETVWAADVTNNAVYVVSGPVPTSLDLVSIPVSIPISTVSARTRSVAKKV